MKPKVYASIDMNEARSPLVRVVHADEWDLLMNELRYLQRERGGVVAWLHREAIRKEAGAIPWEDSDLRLAADAIERGEHRREEER